MIDLHCHLLPGIDDGALDLDDSVAMARVAAGDGIEAICATPHIRHDHDVRIHELPRRIAEVQERLRREGVPVRVLPGGEVAETALHGLDEDELRQASLGGAGRWVLLEPAPGPLGDSLEQAVRDLAERGYGSLVAHPERHFGEDLPERLARLVGLGALVQATADAFVDERSSRSMLELAAKGVVHVLGSDAHSSLGGRAVRLAPGLERLAEVEPTREHLRWVSEDAPAAIVRGEPLEPPFEPSV